MRTDLPTGTVTLVFTDIEGSTRLLHELGAEAYAEALAEHRRLLRDAYGRHRGVEVDTQGDAFFYVFPVASEAVAAAEEGGEALKPGPIRIRVGIHTGEPHLGPEGYVGQDVHLGARIGAAGHGGQVLITDATRSAAGLAGVELLDLGAHRLKDFEQPILIFQLGVERFPPLKTISNTNLPRPASSFVGREKETAEIVDLIRHGARFVTLTGPGGSGKTRLAIEAGAELVGDHSAGTFWVELAPIRDAVLVSEEIAKTLGAKDGLADHIGERELLLVLDNLEQVIDAGPALAELVETCPNLTVLATSRERLRVRGETEFEVHPLANEHAADLFAARAGLGSEPDKAVRELCRALDEMPLAIELAAARAKVLPPAQILERLSRRLDLFTGGRDADARQRTLRSTIEWSYDLLGPDERRLFARLAVFAGGCTLPSSEQVAEADLDTLGSLVEKNLVRRSHERYWMYETIREFALERLDASGEADDLRRRHAEHFLELAEDAEPYFRGSRSREWLGRTEAEHDNLRAAMDRLEATGEGHGLQRLVGALWPFWYIRGYLAEASRRLEAALSSDEGRTAARVKALQGAAVIAETRGDPATAKLRVDEALGLSRELGDAFGTAYSTFLLGHAATVVPDWRRAQRLFEESLRAFEGLGEDYFVWLSTDLLALACYKVGDRNRATELAEANLRRGRETGDDTMEASALGALGLYAVSDGRMQEAIPLLAASTRIWRDREGEDADEVGLDLCGFARALASTGKPAIAVQLMSAVASLNEQIGATEASYVSDLNEGTLTLVHEQLDEAAFAGAWDRGRNLTVEEAIVLALAETS